MEQSLAFKYDIILSYEIGDVGKQVRTNARLTSYDNPVSTLR